LINLSNYALTHVHENPGQARDRMNCIALR